LHQLTRPQGITTQAEHNYLADLDRKARAKAERDQEQERREAYEQEKEAVRQAILSYSFNELAYRHRDL
jgi:hypothetical protein